MYGDRTELTEKEQALVSSNFKMQLHKLVAEGKVRVENGMVKLC